MKKRIDDLAIFGGTPAFVESLHVGYPNLGSREKLLYYINDILDRRWLTNQGVYVQRFEERVADFVGAKYCIATCNATIGLMIAMKALGLMGEAIIPAFTFIATAHALQWQEVTPIFCDIDPRTHNIDPEKVERLITPRTTGIIGVHVWGRACKVEALTQIARRYNLKLMFDAAHAFGCSYQGRMIGNFGDCEVFSFHATKFVNTSEGGAIVTNDGELARRARLMKNFGFADFDRVDVVGINGKMSELSAAIGLANLESLKDFVNINYRNYGYYQKYLRDIDGIELVLFEDCQVHNYQYIVIKVDENVTSLSRDQLQKILWKEKVLARRYFYPGCHRMEPYRTRFPDAGVELRETEKLAKSVLCLPTGPAVGEVQVNLICQIIRVSVENGVGVKRRMDMAAEGESYVKEAAR
jgi:dTDP-4-amino-4,6-dideoxygalactose transaminase